MIKNEKDAIKMVCNNFEGYSSEDSLAARKILSDKKKEISAEASQYKGYVDAIEEHLANTLEETEQVSFKFDDGSESSACFKSSTITEVTNPSKLLAYGEMKGKTWVQSILNTKLLIDMIEDGTETDPEVLKLIETKTISQLKFSTKKAKK